MARAKKNTAFMHPIDTVVSWYAEVQTIPAQLKQTFAID